MTIDKKNAGLARRLATRVKALGAMAALGACAAAHADPGVHVAFGRDPGHNIDKYELGINWDSGFAWGNPQGWQVKLQWEAELAEWNARSGTNAQNVTEFGFSPIFRLEKRGGALVPFLEASVGVRMMSHKATSDEHRSGSLFQFSDMIGVGMAFGPKTAYEAGFRYQHVSNAGIKQPNPGSGFYTGYMRYRF
ncbi:acyloxyacyl hydrolase [Cupriavidus basilensis]|uniref:acyloxyacyl hydrolase n=1 Tax=Cupriavidus basilensis TaxID=68895 RepID=UPI0020A685D6|nr:acyloxyacyl hydrolase [Cupriavidus basilensis]MCP3024133.1 acyloxyacyl hydrolase [Cupriavidus basilensis]MDR3382021.1 acyloxyacyl hydrolase [Cupriavidus basilensis]